MKYDDILNSRFAEPAAIISYNGGTVYTLSVNSKFIPELWMNIAEQDYINADIHASFDDENLNIYIRAIEKAISTGEETTVETWRSLVSNCCGFDRICLKSRLIPLENGPEGAIIYESVRNITNEKRTQDTLLDIEHRYKSASEQINIYNWEYTIATKEMRPCYRCMRDLGLPALVTNYPEPAIDMGIFPPDYADFYRDMMRKIDNGAKELEADIPLTVGRVPFRVKYTTEFDDQGNPVKAFGSATLISDTELGRIKLDNQIIASLAEEYQGIFMMDFKNDRVNIIKDSDIFTLDKDSDCNELAGQIVAKLPELPEEHVRSFSDINALRTSLFKDSDIRAFVYKDEPNSRWIRIDYHVIERNDDQVDRILITASVLDDLSAQKMDADRLIAEQKAELEDRQTMLEAAIDEANKANKAKTVFFSNMSHDIRTPMSAINGFSKLAKEELDNRAHLEDYLDKIVTAGDHLLSLINDILDMSRTESGKMELHPVPVRLKELVVECADMIRGKTEEKDQHFTVDIDRLGDDRVSCDKLRFRQILLNLLSNAYKFTPEGGSISLSSALTGRDDKLNYEFRIKDTGIGMSKEFSEQIWDAFTREKTSTVNETQGTGLGMAIVRNIVNMMHGTIELKTELGKGSEFIILLSLDPVQEASGASETSGVSGVSGVTGVPGVTEVSDGSGDSGDQLHTAGTEGASGDSDSNDPMKKRYDGVNILVVDDTELNLKLAEYVLQRYGFNVQETKSGIEAIEIVKASKPGDIDLILMDVSMPVMSGLEATRRIRALPDAALARIPIIAMTANAFASDIKDALDAGMNAHVPKPFDEKDLITKIAVNLG
ncbi:MAG: response regulator [Lachnospiraceae bacterium]|nr:response regulator [Lachnospiraceae bacterium]